MSENIVAIVQARMGASRLPGKMMLQLHGAPIIEWVFHRVAQAREIDKVVFALPDSSQDDVLASCLEQKGAVIERGSEGDVLARFWQAASAHHATHIVRVCADNPLIAPEEIDNLVRFYRDAGCDYAYNHVPKGNRYPDGLGAEMVSVDVLSQLHRAAHVAEHREHVFNYLWAHADEFTIATFDPPNPAIAHPELKLDCDELQDYVRLQMMDIRMDMSAGEIVDQFLESA